QRLRRMAATAGRSAPARRRRRAGTRRAPRPPTPAGRARRRRSRGRERSAPPPPVSAAVDRRLYSWRAHGGLTAVIAELHPLGRGRQRDRRRSTSYSAIPAATPALSDSVA